MRLELPFQVAHIGIDGGAEVRVERGYDQALVFPKLRVYERRQREWEIRKVPAQERSRPGLMFGVQKRKQITDRNRADAVLVAEPLHLPHHSALIERLHDGAASINPLWNADNPPPGGEKERFFRIHIQVVHLAALHPADRENVLEA